jgi:hypothetical protein
MGPAQFGRASLLAAEAGESRLIAGVDGSRVATAATRGTAARSTTGSTASATLTTTSTTATLAATAAAVTPTTLTTAATAGALRLDEAGVEVDGLLDLLLLLALGLATGAGEVLLLLVLEGLGISPLLVDLGALVGLTDLQAGIKAELLLSQLGKVVGVGDALVLGLSGLLTGGILGEGLLLLGAGDSLSGLLIVELSLALNSAGLGSLLVGAASSGPNRVTVIPIVRAASTTSTTDTGSSATTGGFTGSLLGGAALVAGATSTTVTESTIVATEATATAVATSTGAANGSLGLDVALAGASVHLVNGLDRDGRLLLAVRVIAESGVEVLGNNRGGHFGRLGICRLRSRRLKIRGLKGDASVY